jgi:protein-S-isoprenylcysteine O-methyltransferase Ste14
MDTARYYLAIALLLALPYVIIAWSVIHPFAKFWRRIGGYFAWVLVWLVLGGIIITVNIHKKDLLAVDLGHNIFLVILSIVIWVVGLMFRLKYLKPLTFDILIGNPEIFKDKYPGKLLTEGIYSKIRHPRYLQLFLVFLGFVMFANYLMPYIFLFVFSIGMFFVIILEERELQDRFGTEYQTYCSKVPYRLMPGVF